MKFTINSADHLSRWHCQIATWFIYALKLIWIQMWMWMQMRTRQCWNHFRVYNASSSPKKATVTTLLCQRNAIPNTEWIEWIALFCCFFISLKSACALALIQCLISVFPPRISFDVTMSSTTSYSAQTSEFTNELTALNFSISRNDNDGVQETSIRINFATGRYCNRLIFVVSSTANKYPKVLSTIIIFFLGGFFLFNNFHFVAYLDQSHRNLYATFESNINCCLEDILPLSPHRTIQIEYDSESERCWLTIRSISL